MLPCAVPATTYVELAGEALLDAFTTIIEPDAKEVYHHVTGEPLVHTIRTEIDSLDETLGTDIGYGTRFAGKFLGAADQIVWWLFVLRALSDGLIDATSQFLRMNPCKAPNGYNSGNAYISGIPDNGVYSPLLFEFPEGSKYAPVSAAQIYLSEANNWTGIVAASAYFETIDSQAVGVSGRLQFDPDDGSPSWLYDSFSNANPDGSVTQPGNHLFARVQSPGARNGFLRMLWAYTGDPLPDHEALLKGGSSCYLSGGGSGD